MTECGASASIVVGRAARFVENVGPCCSNATNLRGRVSAERGGNPWINVQNRPQSRPQRTQPCVIGLPEADPVAVDRPAHLLARRGAHRAGVGVEGHAPRLRSEEHTSELQSLMRLSYAVFCLQKKK